MYTRDAAAPTDFLIQKAHFASYSEMKEQVSFFRFNSASHRWCSECKLIEGRKENREESARDLNAGIGHRYIYIERERGRGRECIHFQKKIKLKRTLPIA